MRSERERSGLTAEEVAKIVGVHQNALRRWEKGQSEPLSSHLFSLAKLYGCSPEKLLINEEEDDK